MLEYAAQQAKDYVKGGFGFAEYYKDLTYYGRLPIKRFCALRIWIKAKFDRVKSTFAY